MREGGTGGGWRYAGTEAQKTKDGDGETAKKPCE